MSVSFGDSIRRGREVAGLSQAKVAELIGKSPSTVRSWELGRTSPSEASAVSALAAVLGIDEPTLLGRAGFDQPIPPPRLTLEQELEALRTADPIPIPAPEALPKTPSKEKRSKLLKTPLGALRQGPPRHLIPKGIDLQPMPPLLAAATVPPETEEKPISITVVPPDDAVSTEASEPPTSAPVASAPVPAASGEYKSRERKVTVVPRLQSGTARSYIEESDQKEFYRWRGVVTLVCLVVLFLAFWWALRNLGGAISDFFGGFIDLLNF